MPFVQNKSEVEAAGLFRIWGMVLPAVQISAARGIAQKPLEVPQKKKEKVVRSNDKVGRIPGRMGIGQTIRWKWSGLKSWVSVHFVRHKHGIEHWVSTQRTDRTGVDRDASRQDTPVDHECLANAQSLIFISRRRLCGQASPETREAWKEVKRQVADFDPVLASVMVPECIYRGFCPEFKSCGFADTEEYKRQLAEYRRK